MAINLTPTYAATGRSERAREVLESAMVQARAAGDPAVLFDALVEQSALLRRFHQPEASLVAIREAEGLLAAVETPRRRVRFLQNRGYVLGVQGDLAGAARDFDELQRICGLYANEAAARATSVNFAEFEHERGNTTRAIEIMRDALPVVRRRRSAESLATALVNISAYLLSQGQVEEGREFVREALQLCRDSGGGRLFGTIAVEETALALALSGRMSEAARLAGYAKADFAKLEFNREHTEQVTGKRLTELLEALPDAERASLGAEGAALSEEAALDAALAALRELVPVAP
jgi:tetratricopeptide (TPR) repeat protein